MFTFHFLHLLKITANIPMYYYLFDLYFVQYFVINIREGKITKYWKTKLKSEP